MSRDHLMPEDMVQRDSGADLDARANEADIIRKDYWADYEAMVRKYEAEGMTRSDAQGCADADMLKAGRSPWR